MRGLSEASWTVSSDTYFLEWLWVAKAVCEDSKWVDLGPVPGALVANRVSGEPFLAKFEAKMPDKGLVVNTYLNKLSRDVETDADTPT